MRSIFEISGSGGSSLRDGKSAELHEAESLDVTDNVTASAVNGLSATPLYGQLAMMCDRIVRDENVSWTELCKCISACVDENEPEGRYNYAAIMKPQESNGNTGLYRFVRKALKTGHWMNPKGN